MKNPACQTDCRCGDCKCPSPPTVDVPACWAVMPCPDPPDRRVRACFPHRPTDGRPEPLHARVIKDEVQNHDLIVTLSIGSDAGLGKDWHGYVLTGETEEPLADLFLLRITKRVSIARVHLTVDQIHDNTRVLLTPPN